MQAVAAAAEAVPVQQGFVYLPGEVITKIASLAYPNGGQAAIALALTHRRIYSLVRPIIWASLVVPEDPDGLLDFLDELRRASVIVGALARNTTSIRYNIPTYQRITVVTALRAHAPLRRLHLHGNYDDDVDGFFYPEHGLLRDPALHAGYTDGVVDTGRIIKDKDVDGLQAFTSTDNFTWHGDLLGSRYNLFNRMGLIDALAQRTTPFSVTVKDATELFAMGTPWQGETAFRILNRVGTGELHRLTLPVFRTFYTTWCPWWDYLSLPKLTELMLDVAPPKNGGVGSRDFLAMVHDWTVDESPNYKQLMLFLDKASLPNLSTLRLRGWVDGTGAATVGLTPAPPPPSAPSAPRHTRNYMGSNPPAGYVPAAESPLIESLLDRLRRMHVSELRLENSRGHPEGDFGCIFSYQATTSTWDSRVVRLWY
ncbi:hypothetical protein RQP46_009498 [Phenoliferia psychrophenolica]